jgi:hypothetical protein
VRIITDYVRTIEALTTASSDSLDHTTLHSSYENAINLPHVLHSSESLTDWFAALVTENEDLSLECDTAIANCNMLTARVMQLEAQLMQTLHPMTATTSSSPTGHKEQTDPEKFTAEDHSKLMSFITLVCSRLIDHPREFPNEQSKL